MTSWTVGFIVVVAVVEVFKVKTTCYAQQRTLEGTLSMSLEELLPYEIFSFCLLIAHP